ncbi:hypothetical protein F164LOC_18810 [Pectobacterium carotovorum]|nr:hypothetical protein F164LOC_18810 [Pectobacterium carotovorum]
MSRYSIEENIKYDSNGTEISRTWDIFDLDGTLLKNEITSEFTAQSWVKAAEDKDFLFEETNSIKPETDLPKNK